MSKKKISVLMVLLISATTLGTVFSLASNPQQRSQPPESAPQQAPSAPVEVAANNTASPDLTKVNAYDYLALVPLGNPAPDFAVKNARNQPVKLADYRGKKNLVLIFFQGSFCSVCGHQLENLQSHLKDFNQQDAEILAISADDLSHSQKTLGEHGLSFHVIPDPTKSLIKRFGVENVTRDGIAWPSAYIIDKAGKVRYAFADKIGTRVHSDTLLPELAKITGKPAPKLAYEE